MPPHPAWPPARAVGDVLADDRAALGRLVERLRESTARYEAVAPLLPAALAAHVRPGPLDDEGWTLVAANPAVAAKLRHWLPRFDEALAARGWKATTIRVHVQAR